MNTKDFSGIQEKAVANYLNWNRVSGSGARPFNKGDVYSDKWLGECKTHMKSSDSIVIYYSHLAKISNEAMFSNRKSVLIVDNGSQLLPCTWSCFYSQAIMPLPKSTYCIKINNQLNVNDKTISFNHTKLRSLYDTLVKKYIHVVFVVTWQDKQICLCPISEFKYISEVVK